MHKLVYVHFNLDAQHPAVTSCLPEFLEGKEITVWLTIKMCFCLIVFHHWKENNRLLAGFNVRRKGLQITFPMTVFSRVLRKDILCLVSGLLMTSSQQHWGWILWLSDVGMSFLQLCAICS